MCAPPLTCDSRSGCTPTPRRCEQLNLWNSAIGAVGAAALADALMANRTLTCLTLSGNSIGDEGAAALVQALATNCSLRTVCFATGGPQWVGSECSRWLQSWFLPGARFQGKCCCQRRWLLAPAVAHVKACERGWW